MEIRIPLHGFYRAAAISAASLVGSCAAVSPTADRAPTAEALTPAPAATVPSALRDAVTKWRRDGGTAQIDTLAEDSAAMAAADHHWQIAGRCYVLLLDVHAAQESVDIPDSAAEQLWSSALDAYARGALECARGADANEDAIVAEAARDFGAGTSFIGQLKIRLDNLSHP